MSAWSVSVLTSTTSDTSPTLVVDFGVAKYFFNAGEGTGRAWLQSHHSIRKTKALFLTAAGTSTCGGVPGLLMLCGDSSVPSMDVVGPYGLTHYLATMRGYTFRPSMVVKAIEAPRTLIQAGPAPPEPVFKDENLTVYSIPSYSSADKTSFDASHPSSKRKRSPSPPSSSKRPAHTSPTSPTHRFQASNFFPSTLIGEDAQEWRRLMLRQMFPLQESRQVAPFSSKKGKQAVRTDAMDEPPPPTHTLYHPSKMYARLPSLGPAGSVLPTLSYLLVGPVFRGKFDAKKAQDLGVPFGSERSRLTKGETITFEVDDGRGGKIQRTVRPEECVAPNETPQAILIFDVPTPAHIPSLVASFNESSFLSRYRSRTVDDRKEHPVHAVYHMCGNGVLEDDRYKAFMNGFSEETYHLVSSREHTPDNITFTRSALLQAKLTQLDPDMFPVPKYDTSPARELKYVTGLPSRTVSAEPHTVVHVRPVQPPARDERAKEDEFHSVTASNTLPQLSRPVKKKYTVLQAEVEARIAGNPSSSQPGDDVVITPLGTGSAIPTRLRNVSGTLIQIPGHGAILLDCGEGTWGQLVRSFADDPACSKGVWQVLRDLKCIFLSHMHGDHHTGLSKILMMRTRMNPPPTEPLYVVGLRQHLMYILERQELEDHGLADRNGVILVLSDTLNWRPARPYGYRNKEDHEEPFMNAERSRENAQALCHTLGLQSFTTVDVEHRVRCYGVVIRHRDGWGIAFSGDTMPTENLVKVGRDVTLLIHESSMSPEEEYLAREKAHSTSAQAISIGQRMNARNLLLTHFSARYPGMPPRQRESAQSGGPLIGLAFDYSRIRLGDMWKLNMYLPAIQQTLNEFGEEDPAEIDLAKLQ